MAFYASFCDARVEREFCARVSSAKEKVSNMFELVKVKSGELMGKIEAYKDMPEYQARVECLTQDNAIGYVGHGEKCRVVRPGPWPVRVD